MSEPTKRKFLTAEQRAAITAAVGDYTSEKAVFAIAEAMDLNKWTVLGHVRQYTDAIFGKPAPPPAPEPVHPDARLRRF